MRVRINNNQPTSAQRKVLHQECVKEFDKLLATYNKQVALQVSSKYGKNALLRGLNYLECSTQRERNTFIGGHRAGDDKTGKS